MLNYIFSFMMLISVFCAIVTNNVDSLTNSIFTGSENAVKLIISMFGMMSFWNGIMKIAEEEGLTFYLSKKFFPILKFLFPQYSLNKKVLNAICMNIIANFLGLGNAATPFGLKAMEEMQKENKDTQIANNGMAMFVIINTASFQLVPTFLAIIRQKHGSAAPFSILPALWITSIISLTVGILSAKILERIFKS